MALRPLSLPNFSGEYDEDIDIFNSRFSSYLADVAIDPVASRDQAFGILRGCLYGRALEWFDRKILAHDYANIAGNNAVTVANSMIPAEAFTEDWRLAGGQTSDRPVNAINAGNNNPIESEPIGEFYSKLLKYGKMLNLDEQQIKGQILRGLSPDLEDDAERIVTSWLKSLLLLYDPAQSKHIALAPLLGESEIRTNLDLGFLFLTCLFGILIWLEFSVILVSSVDLPKI
ncbi:2600_t:CDS:2 [Acaulospora colombiana]|uniref:2600_t:CDS:1 n=1 Tax=Acaulospora colombiana TaxID=27376 RepID=A0ACA9KGW9_9GLOM|nr:2600_t:CDS:2 [Acaulospora colombiana]